MHPLVSSFVVVTAMVVMIGGFSLPSKRTVNCPETEQALDDEVAVCALMLGTTATGNSSLCVGFADFMQCYEGWFAACAHSAFMQAQKPAYDAQVETFRDFLNEDC